MSRRFIRYVYVKSFYNFITFTVNKKEDIQSKKNTMIK
jgi:hypothetical protein